MIFARTVQILLFAKHAYDTKILKFYELYINLVLPFLSIVLDIISFCSHDEDVSENDNNANGAELGNVNKDDEPNNNNAAVVNNEEEINENNEIIEENAGQNNEQQDLGNHNVQPNAQEDIDNEKELEEMEINDKYSGDN